MTAVLRAPLVPAAASAVCIALAVQIAPLAGSSLLAFTRWDNNGTQSALCLLDTSQPNATPSCTTPTTQLLDRDAKRVQLFHEMYHAEQGYLAATNETIVMNIDFASRRSAPWPVQAAQRLEAVWATHKDLPRPAKAGRMMGLKKTT